MRYSEMLEQYKGYGEIVKGLRDALEPMAGYQSTLASNMSAWTAATSVSNLFDNQLKSVIQSYSGGKIESFMSQIDKAHDFYNPTAAEAIKSAMSGYSGIAEQINQFNGYKNIAEALNSYSSVKDVIDSVYSSLDFDDEEENIEELETDFADEQELQDALEEEFTDENKFAKRIKSWAKEKLKKYNIYKFIGLFIINVFILPYLEENVGKPVMTKVVSIVKEAPEKGAEIIYRLKDGVQAIIMENTNYYYKVKFTDENGVEREGYVAKKNLKVIKEKMEQSEDNDMEDE